MMDHRTKKQIDADELDRQIHFLCLILNLWAKDNNEKDIAGMAISIDAMRYRVRKHMCAEDREKTKYSFRDEGPHPHEPEMDHRRGSMQSDAGRAG